HLIWIPQRHPNHAVVSWFERDDVFARGEDDFAECNHSFLAYGLPDHRKCLLSDFTVWNDKVWIAQVEFVDSAFGTNSSISMTRLLSMATASSSSGSSSMYSPFATS